MYVSEQFEGLVVDLYTRFYYCFLRKSLKKLTLF